MYKQEKGASFFSMLIVLMMAGTLLATAFKIYQPYLNHLTIKSVIENVTQDYDELRKPIPTIRADINKRLYINQVNLPTQDALVIVNDKGLLKFNLKYEVRLPMFFNVDAVIKFSEYYEAVVP
ncbi:DUF4845 domain-containing protein [Neptunomonas antarctica]|uniref:DUF4845 domain-containing protein n=1 Tax=Neptunomonas antarctica TaxID=619304 RepID=A0A1N7N080_9GAMM|nr:DUF4845 domain-containing protein [Neptunomonas antarctica]SIS91760.1 protein of unknown function [Neptunomonas antarctica]